MAEFDDLKIPQLKKEKADGRSRLSRHQYKKRRLEKDAERQKQAGALESILKKGDLNRPSSPIPETGAIAEIPLKPREEHTSDSNIICEPGASTSGSSAITGESVITGEEAMTSETSIVGEGAIASPSVSTEKADGRSRLSRHQYKKRRLDKDPERQKQAGALESILKKGDLNRPSSPIPETGAIAEIPLKPREEHTSDSNIICEPGASTSGSSATTGESVITGEEAMTGETAIVGEGAIASPSVSTEKADGRSRLSRHQYKKRRLEKDAERQKQAGALESILKKGDLNRPSSPIPETGAIAEIPLKPREEHTSDSNIICEPGASTSGSSATTGESVITGEEAMTGETAIVGEGAIASPSVSTEKADGRSRLSRHQYKKRRLEKDAERQKQAGALESILKKGDLNRPSSPIPETGAIAEIPLKPREEHTSDSNIICEPGASTSGSSAITGESVITGEEAMTSETSIVGEGAIASPSVSTEKADGRSRLSRHQYKKRRLEKDPERQKQAGALESILKKGDLNRPSSPIPETGAIAEIPLKPREEHTSDSNIICEPGASTSGSSATTGESVITGEEAMTGETAIVGEGAIASPSVSTEKADARSRLSRHQYKKRRLEKDAGRQKQAGALESILKKGDLNRPSPPIPETGAIAEIPLKPREEHTSDSGIICEPGASTSGSSAITGESAIIGEEAMTGETAIIQP
ncbi:streptococcal hemagglutinin-like [Bactrocera oleae]|uniref:streptococcal hemagglutinin-like n=1 Tax=Bactrocera oleae TaxID=104688 RepID=UPI00387E7AB4